MSKKRQTDRSIESITDELLVQKSQQGSRPAIEALIKRWQEPLWRHAVRLIREPSLADDVLQDSLVAIVRQLSQLKDPNHFRAWAYRIVTHKAADLIRKRQQQRTLSEHARTKEEAHREVTSDDDPADVIRVAMSRLNEKDRLILTLFYLEEMSVLEVSKICEVPPGTVKSRLSKARTNLKKILHTHFNLNNQNP